MWEIIGFIALAYVFGSAVFGYQEVEIDELKQEIKDQEASWEERYNESERLKELYKATLLKIAKEKQ